MVALEDEVRANFGLADVELRSLSTLVNDVFVVETSTDSFALKLYHANRTREQVQWEAELLLHLRRGNAPVVAPIEGRHGPVEVLRVDGTSRLAVLYAWAPGEKPAPTRRVYALLGAAAARVHKAADTFSSDLTRDEYDARALIDDQLARMKGHLSEAGRWSQAVALGARLREFLASAALDRGVCHMDLTLDNVHLSGDDLTVFDFDSAGPCWRAIEPHGVLKLSASCFEEWLSGYRSVRAFTKADEHAVSAFTVIGDLRVVAWKLGVADSSRGHPLLSSADLPVIVDQWLEWEAAQRPCRPPT
jgi:Ser/Thr protein kinase RdoA (MazF antagonist)